MTIENLTKNGNLNYDYIIPTFEDIERICGVDKNTLYVNHPLSILIKEKLHCTDDDIIEACEACYVLARDIIKYDYILTNKDNKTDVEAYKFLLSKKSFYEVKNVNGQRKKFYYDVVGIAYSYSSCSFTKVATYIFEKKFSFLYNRSFKLKPRFTEKERKIINDIISHKDSYLSSFNLSYDSHISFNDLLEAMKDNSYIYENKKESRYTLFVSLDYVSVYLACQETEITNKQGETYTFEVNVPINLEALFNKDIEAFENTIIYSMIDINQQIYNIDGNKDIRLKDTQIWNSDNYEIQLLKAYLTTK